MCRVQCRCRGEDGRRLRDDHDLPSLPATDRASRRGAPRLGYTYRIFRCGRDVECLQILTKIQRVGARCETRSRARDVVDLWSLLESTHHDCAMESRLGTSVSSSVCKGRVAEFLRSWLLMKKSASETLGSMRKGPTRQLSKLLLHQFGSVYHLFTPSIRFIVSRTGN
jgi:hypothetical protein